MKYNYLFGFFSKTLFWNNDNAYNNKILNGLLFCWEEKERKENKTERIMETPPFVS